MTKHTSGPWSAAPGPCEENEGSVFWIVFAEADAETAPARAGGDTRDQAEANARLIALAPELLAFVERVALPDISNPEHFAFAMEARALLARAKGG